MRGMPPPTVRIAIVGFGSIARSHLSALRSIPVTGAWLAMAAP